MPRDVLQTDAYAALASSTRCSPVPPSPPGSTLRQRCRPERRAKCPDTNLRAMAIRAAHARFDQRSTAGLSRSSHQRRKLVGVVLAGVRRTALSSPWFLANAISVMPCAIASDMPRWTNPAL